MPEYENTSQRTWWGPPPDHYKYWAEYFHNLFQNKILDLTLLGLKSEWVVVQYFLKQDYRLLWHRKEFLGVELDLVFWYPKMRECIIVEVKSVRGDQEVRVSEKQRKRLEMAFDLCVETWHNLNVRLHLAAVQSEQVFLIEDFLVK